MNEAEILLARIQQHTHRIDFLLPEHYSVRSLDSGIFGRFGRGVRIVQKLADINRRITTEVRGIYASTLELRTAFQAAHDDAILQPQLPL